MMMPPPPPNHAPSDGIEKPKNILGVPKYIFRRMNAFFERLFYIIALVFQASPPVLFVLALFCLLDGLLPVVGAYISRELINIIAELIGTVSRGDVAQDLFVTLSPVLFILLLQLIHHFLRRVLGRMNTMVTAIAGELVVNHIRLKIIGKAKSIDQRMFDSPDFYEKLENANREAGMRPIAILDASFRVISALISAISFVVVLATLTPLAPIVIIAASIPGALVNYYFKNKNFRYMRRHSKERRQMNYYSSVMTNKQYAKEIKLLSLGDTFTDKYNESFKKYYKGLKRIITREGIMQVVVSLLQVLAHAVLFAYVAYTVIFGNRTIGDYSLYTGALTSIATYVATLVASTATIYEGTLFIENMIDFMNEPATVVPTVTPARIPRRDCEHTIEFVNVSFRYPGLSYDVIRNLNLKFTTGESVVLVGLNGAGKTTLIKLLTRLYDPTEGVVLLDGVDIREYDVDRLYDMFGIIFQDFGRYSDTVSENIRFGDISREYNEADIHAAAENSGSVEYIQRLPHGYDTPLTRLFEESGVDLSGGEWQKLSVARAFYKDSDILIMDEPTASLDPLAENEIFKKFEQLSAGKLSVFVSHRLGGAVAAGKIVVMDNGEVVEVGKHDELMEAKGMYHTLFTTQAKRYIDNN